MIKNYYRVCGSKKGFCDTWRDFENLEEARKSAEEFEKNNLRYVTIEKITETEKCIRSESIS